MNPLLPARRVACARLPRPARHARFVVLLVLALSGTSCAPSPRTGATAEPAAATVLPSPATPTPSDFPPDATTTATPPPMTPTPDPWGYAPGDTWIAPLDEAEDGALLARLQSLLDARDVDGLAALVGVADDTTARLKLRAADGQGALRMLTADDARSALATLLAGTPPHWPAVQSSAHGNGDEAGSEASMADVWVALSGWPVGHGYPMIVVDSEATPPAATTSTGTMVWRFTPAGDGWRWIEWRLGEGTYRATVEDLAQDLQDDATYPALIHAVRRAEWWPPNDAPCEVVSKSPDGAWTACSGEGEGRDVGVGYFRPQRLEVRSADGATTHVAVSRWVGDGFGTLSVDVIGWSAAPTGLVFSLSGCGDGCGPWICGGSGPKILTVPDGRLRPVEVAGMDYALAPDGHQLATLGPGEAGRIVLQILHLASGTVKTTALDGEGGSFAWSPDGASIAIAAQFGVCAFDDSQKASLHRLDVATGALTTLVPVLPGTLAGYRADAWSDPAVLDLHVNRADGDGRWEGIERRDARTGALLGAATATPAP